MRAPPRWLSLDGQGGSARSDKMRVPYTMVRPGLAPVPVLSDPAYEHQDQDNDQHQTQTACRVWSPAGAIRPRRQRTDQEQDKNDEENSSNIHFSLQPVMSPGQKLAFAPRVPWPERNISWQVRFHFWAWRGPSSHNTASSAAKREKPGVGSRLPGFFLGGGTKARCPHGQREVPTETKSRPEVFAHRIRGVGKRISPTARAEPQTPTGPQ